MREKVSDQFWKVRVKIRLAGLVWFLLCFASLLLAFHFNSNLALAFVFMLLSLWVVAPVFGYMNMLGLAGKAVPVSPVYCGQDAKLTIVVDRKVLSLTILATEHEEIDQKTDQSALADREYELILTTEKRGFLKIQSLRLISDYPFGFFSFSREHLLPQPIESIVYPRPTGTRKLPFPEDLKGKEDMTENQDSADIREYAPGDPISRIHWRQSARGIGLMTKLFDDGMQTEDLLLKLQAGTEREQALSQLTRWVAEAGRLGLTFRMEIDSRQSFVGQGKRHVANCLKMLAIQPDYSGKGE